MHRKTPWDPQFVSCHFAAPMGRSKMNLSELTRDRRVFSACQLQHDSQFFKWTSSYLKTITYLMLKREVKSSTAIVYNFFLHFDKESISWRLLDVTWPINYVVHLLLLLNNILNLSKKAAAAIKVVCLFHSIEFSTFFSYCRSVRNSLSGPR